MTRLHTRTARSVEARTARLRGSGAGRRGPRKRPSRGVGQSPTWLGSVDWAMEGQAASEVGKLLAQNQAAAVQTRLKCLIFDPENRARLFGRHPLDIAKHDGGPVDRRKSEDRTEQASAQLGAQHALISHLRPVRRIVHPLTAHIVDGRRGGLALFALSALELNRPDTGHRRVEGDSIDPRRQRRVAPE